jgi:hypothetical protein
LENAIANATRGPNRNAASARGSGSHNPEAWERASAYHPASYSDFGFYAAVLLFRLVLRLSFLIILTRVWFPTHSAKGNIKKLPLISHKLAANWTDALKVLAA